MLLLMLMLLPFKLSEEGATITTSGAWATQNKQASIYEVFILRNKYGIYYTQTCLV